MQVEKAIRQLKNNKSPGADGVRAEKIKAGGESLTKEIHKMCKQIWTEVSIPEEWTKSIPVTIPEKRRFIRMQQLQKYISSKSHGKNNVIDTGEQTEGASGEYLGILGRRTGRFPKI